MEVQMSRLSQRADRTIDYLRQGRHLYLFLGSTQWRNCYEKEKYVLGCAFVVLCLVLRPISSDTTMDFTKAQGDYYWFKFTVHGSHADPQIAAGNGTVLKTGNCKKLKNDEGEDEYRFQVWAIGKPGEASAIYTTLPGQEPVKH